jgi:hypothetical protein
LVWIAVSAVVSSLSNTFDMESLVVIALPASLFDAAP